MDQPSHVREAVFDALKQSDSVEAWHFQVRDQNVIGRPFQVAKCLVTTTRDLNGPGRSEDRQGPSKSAKDGSFVVHYQDFRRGNPPGARLCELGYDPSDSLSA